MMKENKEQRKLVDNEKENFKTELKKSFDLISLPVHIPDHLKNNLEEKKKENFAKFDGATKEVHQESEYKISGKRELEIFANERINKMMKENEARNLVAGILAVVCLSALANKHPQVPGIITFGLYLAALVIARAVRIVTSSLEFIKTLRYIQLVNKEEEKLKRELKSSFDAINLPFLSQGRLKEILDEKKLKVLTNYEATILGQLESEHKELILSARKELEIFANKKINEMMEKNEEQRKLVDNEKENFKTELKKLFDLISFPVHIPDHLKNNLEEKKKENLAKFDGAIKEVHQESEYKINGKRELEIFGNERINEMMKENEEQRKLVDNEKKNFKTELKKSFDLISLPVHIPDHLKNNLEEKKKENLAKFDGATKEVHQESEYRINGKRELEIFANERINEMMKENEEMKRQHQLVDNEKENFKTELKKSFDLISLPVHIPDHLKDNLEEKKKENFAKFDGATKEVHQESEYKINGKRELEIFANGRINEMMKENEEIKRRQLVDIEKKKLNLFMDNLFCGVNFRIHDLDLLERKLEERKEEYFTTDFHRATEEVDQEHKKSVREQLESFANKKINEIIEGKEDIWFKRKIRNNGDSPNGYMRNEEELTQTDRKELEKNEDRSAEVATVLGGAAAVVVGAASIIDRYCIKIGIVAAPILVTAATKIVAEKVVNSVQTASTGFETMAAHGVFVCVGVYGCCKFGTWAYSKWFTHRSSIHSQVNTSPRDPVVLVVMPHEA